jgi:SAM-dependent methyltransferase
MSPANLADASFYTSFYEAFFKKYKIMEDLDPQWLEFKLQVVDLLKRYEQFKKDAAILSIGCGLGTIEKALITDGYSNLEVTEVSEMPLRWLLPCISPDKVHIGFFPECIAKDKVYDFVYLSSVEYCFTQDQLIDFLKAVSKHLKPGGICLLISVSFEFTKPFKLTQISAALKDCFKVILDKIGLRNRGQFFGYTRNRKDFHDAMVSAGLKELKDGFLEKRTRWDAYWIEASR